VGRGAGFEAKQSENAKHLRSEAKKTAGQGHSNPAKAEHCFLQI